MNVIKHDKVHDNLCCWISQFPKYILVIECLRQVIGTSNKHDWRLSKRKRAPKNNNSQNCASNIIISHAIVITNFSRILEEEISVA